MQFYHPSYYTNIDTKSKKIKNILLELNDIYKQLPETKCVQCPLKSGVEADCCKTFSPPMNLVEFVNILSIVDGYSEEQKKELVKNCIDSILNPSIIKPCVLLNGVMCSIYDARPFSCQMFGIYSKKEWDERVEHFSKEISKISNDKTPFEKQCQGVDVVTPNHPETVSKAKSDNLFRKIHHLDAKIFDDFKFGKEVVATTATYAPFDAHYLSIMIGPNLLEDLVAMKTVLRDKLKAINDSENGKKEFEDFQKNVKEFAESLKKKL